MSPDVKLFIAHSPNSDHQLVAAPMAVNVIAGGAFQTAPVADGMVLDNAGDSISSRNKSFCELTMLYWAWKNQEADYYGFCHYRRVFSFRPDSLVTLGKKAQWGLFEYRHL
ncbi:MAG: DUF4422 domain-containing protein, partial [Coriobacteriales bacterium]|nr:DUF4422 domain-containing protein [Coriobacteriales bacterium]